MRAGAKHFRHTLQKTLDDGKNLVFKERGGLSLMNIKIGKAMNFKLWRLCLLGEFSRQIGSNTRLKILDQSVNECLSQTA